MPLVGCGQQGFELSRVTFTGRQNSGRLGGIQAGFPLWQGTWTLATSLTPELSDEWRAWADSLGGNQELFLGHDVERLFPKAYPRGFDALSWSGDCSSWSQDVTGKKAVLTLHGVPPGLQLGMGDYVGFRWTTLGEDRRALVRCLDAATASGGGVIVVTINIAVPTVTPSGAVAHLANPECLMRLDPANTQLTPMGRRRTIGGTIVALQDLLP